MSRIVLDRTQFLRGIASSEYSQDGFFAPDYMNGIDLFRTKTKYGLIQRGYRNTDLSATVVVDAIKWLIQKGGDVFGFGNNGHLYKFTATSSYAASELDSANYSGRSGGRGMAIYHDGTSEKLHYFSDTKIGLYDFSSTYNNSYKTGLQSAPHPTKEWQGILYFGNGRYVGSLNATTENLTHLTLPYGYEVQDIEVYNNYLVILAYRTIGTFNTECRLFFWDTYSTNWNLEYLCPETATALEIYRNDLAVFGNTLRLFNGGAFTVIREFYTGGVSAGATFYKNNMLYYQEAGNIFSYGTRTSQINALSQSFIYNVGISGAIVGISATANQFLVSNSSNLVYICNSGYSSEANFKSVWIPMPAFCKVKKITFVTEKLTTNDSVEVSVYNDDGTEFLNAETLGYSTVGAVTNKTYVMDRTEISNYLQFYFNWGASNLTTNNLIIKKIIIDYDATQDTE